MYAHLHAVDHSLLCNVFIMSQASSTTALITISPVIVVCSGTSSLLTTVTMAPSLMWLTVMSGQNDVILPPLLTLRDSRAVVGLATVPQQQSPSEMHLQAYAKYAMGPPQVRFSFRFEAFTAFYMCWCLF